MSKSDICPVELTSWLTRWFKRRLAPDARQALSCLPVTRAIGLPEFKSGYRNSKNSPTGLLSCAPTTDTDIHGRAIPFEGAHSVTEKQPSLHPATSQSQQSVFVSCSIGARTNPECWNLIVLLDEKNACTNLLFIYYLFTYSIIN